MFRTTPVLFCCICLLAAIQVLSQGKLDKPLAIYRQQIGDQYGIYNGAIYQRVTNINIGHPFFFSDSMMKGKVYYGSTLYDDVPLMLDEVKDELITHAFGKRNLIRLVKLKVDSFTIAGKKFIKRTHDNTDSYYQDLYSGKSRLLKKEVKSITKNIRGEIEAEADTRHYLVIKNKLTRIRNRRTLLKILQQHRKEITRYLNVNNVNYKTDLDEYYARAIKRYDELSQ